MVQRNSPPCRNTGRALSLFGSELDFRGLAPGRLWEASTPDALINDVILGAWFEPGDVIDRIESVQAGQVGTRTRIGYQLHVSNASGSFTVEQLDKGSLLPNAELAGTVQLWEWIGAEGAATFSY